MRKRTSVIFILFCTSCLWMSAQRPFEKQPLPYFGLHMSDAVTCSGHGYTLNMGALMEKGRKSLQFGAIYEYVDHKINGGEMIYKHLLFHRSKSDETALGKRFVPYVKYNFIYRNSTPTVNSEPKSSLKSMTTGQVPVAPTGRISSIEHFIGGGLQVKMFGNLFLDTNIAIGGYFGSINKSSKQVDAIGVHKVNSGYGFAGEVGLAYKFGH